MMFGGPTDEAPRAASSPTQRTGVNFIDTADVYTGGQSEEVTGRGSARATLGSGDQGRQRARRIPNRGGLSRKWVVQCAEESLRRWAPTTSTSLHPQRGRHADGGDRRAMGALARGQDPLLGRLEPSRLAHRRSSATLRASWASPPVVNQPDYNRSIARRTDIFRPVRTTASASCPIHRSRAAC